MPDSCFWDTNILVYDFLEPLSNGEIKKQIAIDELTEKIISNNNKVVISNQVLGEFINVLIRKYKFEETNIKSHIQNILKNFELQLLNSDDYQFAVELCYKYQIGFYDALIVAKAINSHCSVLYSEDLSHNQIFEKKLKVINPFV